MTWVEINAWSQQRGSKHSLWELEPIKGLSVTFTVGLTTYKDKMTTAPFMSEDAQKEHSNQVNDKLAAMLIRGTK